MSYNWYFDQKEVLFPTVAQTGISENAIAVANEHK